MPNRLGSAVSPYLLSHADNPVDWWPWGPEPFAEAARRGVPVMISIGYATCHWCHVMARESFTDPAIAQLMNDRLVAIKVDREEHPDVDASYLAAASAFTRDLGWPLTVFATPAGATYFAGTYFPPAPMGQIPSFRMVLDAVLEAWVERRGDVESAAAAVREAVTAAPAVQSGSAAELPPSAEVAAAVEELLANEDRVNGGFGGAPKFPVAPALLFLARRADDPAAVELARRTLRAMAASPLRDPVDGGFFRYATRADWSVPHYERMLTDNAQLLDLAVALGEHEIAEGVAGFLLDSLRLPSGAFASAQDSESVVAGERTEGGYYALDAAGRHSESPPSVDDKVLSGWNGLAIGALSDAGARFARPDWIEAARVAAEAVLDVHLAGGRLVRASRSGQLSTAAATLDDYGLLAGGLIRLALAGGDPAFAVTARELVEACSADGVVGAPGGADPVLTEHGLALAVDLSEGASPSGLSALADAALRLFAITGERRHYDIAQAALAAIAGPAISAPLSFGAALAALDRLQSPLRQLVVVGPSDSGPVVGLAHDLVGSTVTVAVVDGSTADEWTSSGFELFESRTARDDLPTAYLCESFACRLPLTDAAELAAALQATT